MIMWNIHPCSNLDFFLPIVLDQTFFSTTTTTFMGFNTIEIDYSVHMGIKSQIKKVFWKKLQISEEKNTKQG